MAQALRQLKEQVYQLVLNNDSSEQIYVDDIDDDTNLDAIDVVFGVGVHNRLSNLGYVGVRRKDILRDSILKASSYDPEQIVLNSLPQCMGSNAHVPIWKYMRKAGFVNQDGTLKTESLDNRIATRAQHNSSHFQCSESRRARGERLISEGGTTFEEVVASMEFQDSLEFLSLYQWDKTNVELLRRFLTETQKALEGPSGQPTFWAKLACYYDYISYGPNGFWSDSPSNLEDIILPEEY